jgi:HEAT repeat protein
MRRLIVPLLVGSLLAALLPPRPAGADEDVPTVDPLEALLEERALKTTSNPVVASFLAAEGAALVPEELRERALNQVRAALKNQTSFMTMMLSGAGAMMNSDTMRRQREWAQKQSAGKMMVQGLLGVGPTPPAAASPEQMQREMKQAMVDPWVRGIEAAGALERLGDANGAARFYVHCLEFLPEDWVPEACLERILELGLDRAEALLTWMATEAETIAAGPLSGMGDLAFDDDRKPARDGAPPATVVQLRNAALAGLGALVGSGALPPERSAASMSVLLARSQGKENEPYFRGAAAGLGRSKDARAVAALRRIATFRQDPDAKQVALRALAVGFRDEKAIRQLRGELDDRDPNEQLRAAQALYEIGDEASWAWAVDVITRRRSIDNEKPDIRALVVRDLVELGGERSKAALARALAEGPGNDWLAAWTRVALLEVGDTSQLPALDVDLAKEDWTLDRRGFRSVWRAIRPFLQAAVAAALSGGVGAISAVQQIRQAVSLVGNFAAGERSRYLAKVDARRGATAQLRWQAAVAIGAAKPEDAAARLERLLADEAPPVRLAAALELAELDDPAALNGVARAFALDYGAEDGVSRTPEVRAALLRAAWIRAPNDPRTITMAKQASADADGALRFIGLAMLRPAA